MSFTQTALDKRPTTIGAAPLLNTRDESRASHVAWNPEDVTEEMAFADGFAFGPSGGRLLRDV